MAEKRENDDPQVKDITGWDDKRVIGHLESIVNDREKYTKDSTFTFKITQTSGPGISFKLVANPTADQPGNGWITKISTGESPTHQKLYENLKKDYKDARGKDDTRSFAEDINCVFSNNSKIFSVPVVTRDAYMILLFEIGRRLVSDDEKSSDRKKDFDKLPIASAITKLVKLMEDKKCTFHEVFSRDGDLHCFFGKPSDRKNAIEKIDQRYEEMLCQEQGLEAIFRDKLTIQD